MGEELPFFDIKSPNQKWHLVSYADRVSGKQLISLLEKVFERDVINLGSLPVETKRSFSKEDVIEKQKEIKLALENRGSYGIWADDCMIWQPPINEIEKLVIYEVFNLLGTTIADEPSKEKEITEYYIKNAEQIHTYCLDRCWVIMIYSGPGFPSGTVYLVDHYSKRVMGKRYVDVAYQLRTLGYSTPHIPMPKYESNKIWKTFTANGQTLTCLCGNNLESDETLLRYYLYRPENVDGYVDWIAKKFEGKENPSELIRDTLKTQADTIFQCSKCERFMFISELTGWVMSFVPEKNSFE